jgi:hypothetical protein
MHCRNGKTYCGIIRHVDETHVYYTPYNGVSRASGTEQELDVTNADQYEQPEIDTVQFFGGGFRPFFGGNAILALALFDILAISLFAW